jgi:hypothetical protein
MNIKTIPAGEEINGNDQFKPLFVLINGSRGRE